MAISGAFSTALTALHSTQLRMATTSNNVSNANTEGYNRQRVNTAFRPSNPAGQGLRVGAGVEAQEVTRLVDRFLIEEEIDQSAKLGSTSMRADLASRLDSYFSETDGGGVSERINQFFRKVSDLSSNPEGEVERSQILSMGEELAKTLSDRDAQLYDYQQEIDGRISQKVKEINNLTTQIADLNLRITTIEAGGSGEALDLRDERENLVRDLSTKVGVSYYEDDDGAFNIQLKETGYSLVHKGESSDLSRSGKVTSGLTTFQGLAVQDRVTEDITADVRTGELGAMLDMRDETIPELRGRLDSLTQQLVGQVNRVHAEGAGLSYQDSATAEFSATDTTVEVRDEANSGLAFGDMFQAGDLELAVHDKPSGNVEMVKVTFNGDETLDEIATEINNAVAAEPGVAAGDLTASVATGKLQLNTAAGKDFAVKASEQSFEENVIHFPGSTSGPGDLTFRVKGPDGSVTQETISYNNGDDGGALAATINSSGGRVTANWNGATDELTLSTSGGYEFEIMKDTGPALDDIITSGGSVDRGSSHAFAALGVNSFFSLGDGSNVAGGTANAASSIQVSSYVEGSPERVHAGHLGERLDASGNTLTDSDGEAIYEIGVSDNQAALEMLDLQSESFVIGAGLPRTFTEYYSGTVALAGQEKATADRLNDFQSKVMDQIKTQREQQSGVNTEEEMIKMMNFQRSYQAASKMISTSDSMFGTLLNAV